jgi:hypothetical protein
MTDRVFFHIGLHKTASTWFQSNLFPNMHGLQLIRSRSFDGVMPGTRKLLFSSEELGGSLSRKRAPGDSHKRLRESLVRIVAAAPHPAIIVGFREQAAWLDSAYAQRAKKRALNRQLFVNSFTREELSWCHTLNLIESSCETVFPFLYEELIYAPHALVDDLCRFIGVEPPSNLEALLAMRAQPSARTLPGQFVTRLFYLVSLTRPLHGYGKRLGVRVDRYFKPRRIVLEPELATELHQDWARFLAMAGDRRTRDFSALAISEPERKGSGSKIHVASAGDRPC